LPHFIATIALIGIVILVACLLSGMIERVGIPLVAAFLLLGAALGPYGFALVDIRLNSPELMVLATLGLALVLFSDSVTVDMREIRQRWRLALTVLGPGTLIPAAVIAAAAWWLLGLPAAAAAILGAALASTDPVLLRSALRSPALPPTPRVALRLESGTNDAVLLPIVVLAIAALKQPVSLSGETLGRTLTGLFVLGPVLGAAIGWAGIMMLTTVRSRIGVRRDYESLYAIGIGFAAYAAAEAAGGSGFLAAFSAGLTIAALDVELCDCFLEYGEATSEMLLLLTFVALGTSLIWTGFAAADWRTLVFAAIALSVRSAVLYPTLTFSGVRGHDRKLIALFGPRGLSSLLLALLSVFAGLAVAERVFTVTCLVVLLSLVIHGAIIGVFLRRRSPRPPAPRPIPSGGGVAPTPLVRADASVSGEGADRITIPEVRALQARSAPLVFVDARGAKSFAADARQIVGAVRVSPEDAVRSATEQALTKHGTLVIYCA